MRTSLCFLILASCTCSGCTIEENPTPPGLESDCLQDIVQLTSGFDRAGEAYFSRDMQWLIFQAYPSGEQTYQMHVAPVRHRGGEIVGIGNPIRITPPGTWNSCGYFSQDANTLVFASTAGKQLAEMPQSGYQREGGSYRWSFPNEAEIFRADGWQGAIAAIEPGKTADLAKHPITDNTFHDGECSYSLGGKWIVFTSNRSGDVELWVMRADGSNPVQLTKSAGYDGGAFFSPDGSRLVYRSDRKSNNLLQIFVADILFDEQGNITGIDNEKQLTNDANVNWAPFWHPDGQHIVYTTSKHGHANYELYLMRADGSRKTRLTFTQGPDVLPVFSPNGKYVAWSSKRGGQTTQVYLAKFRLPKGA
jgi:Tol biopolymer transport system component